VAIFSGNELVKKLKYKLNNRCSNSQAEQLAIAKTLEDLETTDIEENSSRSVAIITDSRFSLNSIMNVNNHSYLIEEIWEELPKVERFSRVVAHAGILGNELADQLAKTAVRVEDKPTS
jgi:ribonuclease HI